MTLNFLNPKPWTVSGHCRLLFLFRGGPWGLGVLTLKFLHKGIGLIGFTLGGLGFQIWVV